MNDKNIYATRNMIAKRYEKRLLFFIFLEKKVRRNAKITETVTVNNGNNAVRIKKDMNPTKVNLPKIAYTTPAGIKTASVYTKLKISNTKIRDSNISDVLIGIDNRISLSLELYSND
ncbi:MAG: hypothetical protein IJD88_02545 [Clostridia bacterium]|nr:hypothetical protein [Clostridia bacterium]